MWRVSGAGNGLISSMYISNRLLFGSQVIRDLPMELLLLFDMADDVSLLEVQGMLCYI